MRRKTILLTVVLLFVFSASVYAEKEWRVIPDIPHPGDLTECYVTSDGVVWANFNGKGFYKYDDGEWQEAFIIHMLRYGAATGITESTDGTMYIKATSTIINLQGADVNVFSCPDELNNLHEELIVDKDGLLWIASGVSIGLFDGENCKLFGPEDGIPDNIIRMNDFVLGPDGIPYSSWTFKSSVDDEYYNAIYYYEHGSWWMLPGPGLDGIYEYSVDNLISTASGELFAEMDRFLYRIDNGSWELVDDTSDMSRYTVDGDGVLWAMSLSRGISRFVNNEWQDEAGVDGLPSGGMAVLKTLPNGDVLAYSKDKIVCFSEYRDDNEGNGQVIDIGDKAENIENLQISEIMALNDTVFEDEYGYYYDWIEITNKGDKTANLAGCFLSDNEDKPEKWEFPPTLIEAGKSLLIFASGLDRTAVAELHTNFKISSDGEDIFLFAPDGSFIDSIPGRKLAADISYGRDSDGNLVLFDVPTPGVENASQGFQEFAGDIDFSSPGGFYDGAILLELSPETADAEIRYTTDGSVPASDSNLYTDPISLAKTTVIRCRAFADELMPGKTVTQTYFIDVSHSIPVVSLATEHFEELNNYADIQGSNTDVYDDMERPVHVELYEPDKTAGFSMDAGFGIQGILAPYLPLKSLSIFARNRYGQDMVKYQIFPDIPREEFDAFILRSGGNDCLKTMIKDGFMGSLVDDLDVETMGHRPSIVYVNGEYMGIHNIREKMNEEYLAAHHGVDPDNVDMMEWIYLEEQPNVIEGDNSHYNAMIEFLTDNDISEKKNYDYITTQMEVDNFIDYNTFQIFIGNWDWPHQNVKWWRPGTENGKWRWLIYDLDAGFDMRYMEIFHNQNYLERALDPESTISEKNPPWSTFLLRTLMENDSFKSAFINRMADHLNTIYTPENVTEKLYGKASLIEPEIPRYINRWKDVNTSWHTSMINSPTNIDEWRAMIATMEDFAQQRPTVVRQNYIDFFSLSGTSLLTLASPSEGGTIHLNSLDLDTFPWSGTYFQDVPVTITAEPDLGWRFVRWEGASSSTDETIELTLTGDTELGAVFEETGNDIVIDISQSPYEVSSDLVVTSGMSLTIEAGVEMIMAEDADIIVKGTLTVDGSGEEPVVFDADGSLWGAICFDNAEGESTISHAVIRNGRHGEDSELFPAAISGISSDFTVESVIFEGNVQGIFANGGNVTVRACVFDDSNEDEPINIKNGWGLVEDCRFYDVQEQDAVDFDGVSGGIIRNNFISGSNDDGIDIGDGCADVVISGNRISGCVDKAISIGEESKNITVERCILSDSMFGIAVKDNSTAVIDHVTFFGNDTALAGYEKGEDAFGGGTASVTNSIFAGSETSDIMTDVLSAFTFSFCLSDSELLDGDNNLLGDPLLLAPEYGGFLPQASSPAIDMGDPGSAGDSDGSRSDLGALEYRADAFDLVITEINYNPAGDFASEDWIEIHNSSGETCDLGGWQFSDENDDNIFVLPEGTAIEAGGYLVLCREISRFSSQFPLTGNAIGDFEFGLNNAGDVVRLFDSDAVLRDVVAFDDESPWPSASDGSGATLALKSPGLDNSRPENWGYSSGYGTPGADNAGDVGVDGIEPLAFSLGQNYPNPFNPVTTIDFTIPSATNVKLSVYSVSGQKVAELLDRPMPSGKHSAVFDGSRLSSGLYFYKLEAGGMLKTGKMMLMK